MSSYAIQVAGLSKEFKIGARQSRYGSLRDTLTDMATAPVRRARQLMGGAAATPQKRLFWALKDVSFDIEQGDVVGIIGRNGAGKSTLLKILSRITDPTDGYADIYGRVGSLLEVGTGFHPELTGRENIFLNGAILGMKRNEIERKFDEIVDFAEVEDFIDTTVKHYSSGMYLRLAFSVAAHLEPEILLVDEVLAVGDAAFQQKCIGKMSDVAREGRTVLFVSHNMAAVQALCRRGVFLYGGKVAYDGPIDQAVGAYLRTIELATTVDVSDRKDRQGIGKIRVTDVDISTGGSATSATLATGQPARFAFGLTNTLPNLACIFTIYDNLGQPVANFNSSINSSEDLVKDGPNIQAICDIEELPLVPGSYRINIAITTANDVQDVLEGAGSFFVEQGTINGRPVAGDNGYGRIHIPHRWTVPARRSRG